MPGKRSKTLPPIPSSHSAETAYREKLQAAVRLMTRSYQYWLGARYREAMDENIDAGIVPDNGDLASDAAPKWSRNRLFKELDRLRKYWDGHFADLARKLAIDATQALYKANKTAWAAQVRKAGFDIPMQLTAPQQAILDLSVRENVSLIKSIPQQFHTSIEGVVARGFVAGRDLNAIATEIVKHEGITTRRAATIARDQANKLTAQMNSARQEQLGLKWAVWRHSSAGKEPRAAHVRASREEWIYDTQVGIDFGDGFGYVLPGGGAINCRCGGRTLIPSIARGLTSGKQFDPSKLVAVPGFPGAYKMAA